MANKVELLISESHPWLLWDFFKSSLLPKWPQWGISGLGTYIWEGEACSGTTWLGHCFYPTVWWLGHSGEKQEMWGCESPRAEKGLEPRPKGTLLSKPEGSNELCGCWSRTTLDHLNSTSVPVRHLVDQTEDAAAGRS